MNKVDMFMRGINELEEAYESNKITLERYINELVDLAVSPLFKDLDLGEKHIVKNQIHEHSQKAICMLTRR